MPIANWWHVECIVLRPGYMDQLLAIVGRERSSDRSLPRFQLRVTTQSVGDILVLEGYLRNETDFAANRVRIFVSGLEETIALGTRTRGDGDIKISIPYEHAPLRMHPPQFPAINVQYVTDDDVRVEQIGALTASGPDASGRFIYSGSGLGASGIIERFSIRHDPLEDM